jgi:hypothetical protein
VHLELDRLLLEQLLLVTKLPRLTHELAANDEQQNTDASEQLCQNHGGSDDPKVSDSCRFTPEVRLIGGEKVGERNSHLIELRFSR